MPTLQLHLLGALHLSYDGAPVSSLKSSRLQSLLAYLLLHRQAPQNRQQLAFLFWPDSTEAHARANLRFFLHRLRRALPDAGHFLQIDEFSVMWRQDAPFTLDVATFENAVADAAALTGEAASQALEHAVTLYNGELLPSCYDDWILPERERLGVMYVGALERLSWLLEQQQNYRAAIKYGERLLHYGPAREETFRQLMRLHALNSDRVSALRVFHTCAAVLERELAVEPSPATRAEYEKLLHRTTSTTSVPTALVTPAYAPLQVPQRAAHNLRLALTSFIGRERELDTIQRLRGTTRLLTLTGMGGSGKTRLALEIATRVLLAANSSSPEPGYPDGIWWVDLAPLAEPRLVVQAIAATLGVREQQLRSLRDTLIESLRAKQVFLVLDNCEHLIDTIAELAETLLRACPGLHILATSREPLKLPGETVYSVPPLSLPEPTLWSNVHRFASVADSEAVHLFVERAVLALPTFELTLKNTAPVVEICRKLDGLPLAIELAAARIRLLKVEQIAARLDDRFSLLKAGQRRGDGRHQSLRTVMDWSYELLALSERLLFQRLSVFVGGFTLEAAEAVCSGDGIEAHQLLELVSLLADKSLITMNQDADEARFVLLETIRQYASEKLCESNQADAVGNKYTAYYLAFAEGGNAELEGPRQGLWLERLEREHDNLRATLRRALECKDAEKALRIASALGPFWNNHAHHAEGRQWLEATLGMSGDSLAPARADALLRLGSVMILQGDFAAARIRLEQSLELWKSLGDKRGMIEVFLELANLNLYEGDSITAYRELKAGLELARELGDKRRIALALFRFGTIKHYEGDEGAARQFFEESINLFRQVGWSSWVARVLTGLGEVARVQGDYDRAEAHYRESLALYQALGDKWWIALLLGNMGFVALHRRQEAKAKAAFVESLELWSVLNAPRLIPESLAGLAGVAAAGGMIVDAVRLLGAAAALRDASHIVWEATDRAELEWIATSLRNRLDPSSFKLAWAEGGALRQEEAVAKARAIVDRIP